uniref:Uncharacterized protein n=1 Tax=Knipowitschia caucasica TaxID=637954 RepID=A0AAV2LFJ3_KNICA
MLNTVQSFIPVTLSTCPLPAPPTPPPRPGPRLHELLVYHCPLRPLSGAAVASLPLSAHLFTCCHSILLPTAPHSTGGEGWGVEGCDMFNGAALIPAEHWRGDRHSPLSCNNPSRPSIHLRAHPCL